MDDHLALAELEAALAVCLHPEPPSSDAPTVKRPPVLSETLTSPRLAPPSLPVFPRHAPVLVAAEPRPMARTMVMSERRLPAAPPASMATTLTLHGPPPWAQPIPTPPPMAALVLEPPPVLAAPRRSSKPWLVALVLLAAFVGALAVHPPLRARTRAGAIAGSRAVAHGATALYRRARRLV